MYKPTRTKHTQRETRFSIIPRDDFQGRPMAGHTTVIICKVALLPIAEPAIERFPNVIYFAPVGALAGPDAGLPMPDAPAAPATQPECVAPPSHVIFMRRAGS